MLYYGAQCWTSVLCSSTRLATLDEVSATRARMAFHLEWTIFVEAWLVVAGLDPARQSIMRHLVWYLVLRHGAGFERLPSCIGFWQTSDPLKIRGYMIPSFRAGEGLG